MFVILWSGSENLGIAFVSSVDDCFGWCEEHVSMVDCDFMDG